MSNITKKLLNKSLRKARVRASVSGTADRPRLTVTVSNKHVSAQLVDDVTAKTIAASTTVGSKQSGPLKDQAEFVGTDIAKKAKKANVTKAVFDRNGRQYAGRLGALADAARKEGLEI